MAYSKTPRFGINMFPTDKAIQPVELARAVEERGFDSLFFPEHTHIPVSRDTPFPQGGDLPEMYWRSHDPFVALGACAAVTSTLRLGTGICLVIERDPIQLAKEIASLDMISNGRVILGIGAGWNREEMENHGSDYTKRWKILREKILAMKEIWNNDEAEYHGDYVDFDPIWSWPKPVQAGGPPILMGAQSKWSFDRIAEYCDGWMPLGGLGSSSMEQLKTALEARGRKVEDCNLTLFGAAADVEQMRFRIDQGCDELIFGLPPANADTVLPLLDKLAEMVKTVKAG